MRTAAAAEALRSPQWGPPPLKASNQAAHRHPALHNSSPTPMAVDSSSTCSTPDFCSIRGSALTQPATPHTLTSHTPTPTGSGQQQN
eukprot:11731-Chlamydomonas_euryale.AAC.1